jgi:hypothetical protein
VKASADAGQLPDQPAELLEDALALVGLRHGRIITPGNCFMSLLFSDYA